MQVLKLGDTIAGTDAIVTQVLADKLIVEETIARDGEEPKRQIVWISKPANPGEKSAIQRLSGEQPPQKISVQQVMQPVEQKKQR